MVTDPSTATEPSGPAAAVQPAASAPRTDGAPSMAGTDDHAAYKAPTAEGAPSTVDAAAHALVVCADPSTAGAPRGDAAAMIASGAPTEALPSGISERAAKPSMGYAGRARWADRYVDAAPMTTLTVVPLPFANSSR